VNAFGYAIHERYRRSVGLWPVKFSGGRLGVNFFYGIIDSGLVDEKIKLKQKPDPFAVCARYVTGQKLVNGV
jgi:hypothetical protein